MPARLIVALFAAVLCLGAIVASTRGQDHSQFHKDFYQHWKQPGSEMSCCNARVPGMGGVEIGDCEPTRAELRKDAAGIVRWYAWLRQMNRWEPIPDDKVIRERNPNVFDAHLCWSGRVLCFVPPDTGG